jgi:hypothetical protein
VSTLLEADTLWSGARLGGLAIAVVALIGVLLRRARISPPFPLAGLAVIVAALAALNSADPLPGGVVQAVAMAIVGGAAATVGRFGPLGTAVAYLPGALRLAMLPTVPGAPSWTNWAAAATVCVGGALCADFDRRYRPLGLGPLALVVTVFAAYSTLPDTEHVAPLLGAMLPLAIVALPRAWEGVGSVAWGGALTVLGWVIWIDGRGRPGAVVGAFGALGLLVVEPSVRRAIGRFRPGAAAHGARDPRLIGVGVLAGHAAIAFGAARVAGLHDDVGSALAIVAALWVAGAAASALIPVPAPPAAAPRARATRGRREPA